MKRALAFIDNCAACNDVSGSGTGYRRAVFRSAVEPWWPRFHRYGEYRYCILPKSLWNFKIKKHFCSIDSQVWVPHFPCTVVLRLLLTWYRFLLDSQTPRTHPFRCFPAFKINEHYRYWRSIEWQLILTYLEKMIHALMAGYHNWSIKIPVVIDRVNWFLDQHKSTRSDMKFVKLWQIFPTEHACRNNVSWTSWKILPSLTRT